jgi:ribosomal-protein-serine acetyltransferase
LCAQVGGFRGPYATSPPRLPRDLSLCTTYLRRRSSARIYPIGGMFRLLVDDEISLVLAEERHALAMTDLIVRNQTRLARWEPWAEQPATLESTRAYIRAALEDFLRGRQISTIIAVDNGHHFIGRCGMRINPHAGSGDIGYWIDGEFEGRGIASRASRALISSVFGELGLTKVELRTSVANKRSRALAQRLGFDFEGIMPAGLRFSNRSDDVALYGVTAKQWNGSVKPR